MTMNTRRTFLKGSLAGAAAAAAAPAISAAPAGRPNIVWIVSEDNNPFIGAYGDKLARTPNIDAMAKAGVLYRNAYSNAPVCAPSRFGILTGVLPESNAPANHMRADAKTAGILPTYPDLMRKAGYYVTNNVKTDYNCDVDPKAIWDDSSTKAHWKNRPADKPFMAVFNLMTTHESQNFKPTPGAVTPDQVRVPAYMPDTPVIRADIAGYYNRMAIMDGQVGKLLAELDAAGLSEDTIVFYYSDNGGVLPRSKRYCYDEGLRCALVARVPAKWAHLSPAKAGSEVRSPVSFIDLAPTVLSLAGAAIPKVMQGKALMGRAATTREKYAFGMRNRMDERYDFVRTVSDGRWRYIRNYLPHLPLVQNQAFAWLAKGYQEIDRLRLQGKLSPVQQRMFEPRVFEELYDTQADVDEVNNLADSPAQAGRMAELRRALDTHMLAVNDNGFIPEGSRIEGYVPSRVAGAYPLRRLMALAQAAARGDRRKAGVLRAALGDANEVVRFWGATGFAVQGAFDTDLDRLAKLATSDPVPQVRVAACAALARSGQAEQACPLLAALTGAGQSRWVRLQALNVLTNMGEAARPALPQIHALTTVSDEYLPNAARYLEQVLNGTYDPAKPVYDLEALLSRGSTNGPNPKD
ncbi:sulfatase-like hydrolase/transferase [Novosphingobium sp. SL115]|uniref:sulfatase-like hydrolase/transferase n=1 Tax=Novosphingobium sp. SL115 TaxID=2995150 RepID=UPI0022766598|nr:sulfatase-like hydrolase/transferase [Novosphingobium sp. SL115]MCY1672935.1 sulfatase-like hydrolase/transferase [Novosphingobium sp. SL115]